VKQSHTPGPWIVDFDRRYFVNAGSSPIAEMFTDINMEANARLIAAAPELLEACKEFIECGPNAGNNQDLIAQIKKAIAKADGES